MCRPTGSFIPTESPSLRSNRPKQTRSVGPCVRFSVRVTYEGWSNLDLNPFEEDELVDFRDVGPYREPTIWTFPNFRGPLSRRPFDANEVWMIPSRWPDPGNVYKRTNYEFCGESMINCKMVTPLVVCLSKLLHRLDPNLTSRMSRVRHENETLV